jgi:hypothetical protein
MAIDHDQIFKQLVEAFFREFMELFCPAEAALIDFRNVEFLREEYFTDVPSGRRRQLDLVVKVGLLAGGEQFVLIHVEFESSRPDADFPRRMYRYHCQLYLRHHAEILPVAMFTDDAHWRDPPDEHFELQVGNSRVVRFDYRLIKLKRFDYRDFLSSNNPLAYALMAKMDYNKRQRARLKADFLRLILGCAVDPARKSLLIEFVGTYVPLNPPERLEFDAIIRTDEQYREIEQMVSVFELEGIKKGMAKGMEEGMAKGMEEGMEKGIVKGRADVLLLQLAKRFGPLDEAAKQRVRQIDSAEKLDALLLAVLDARSLDELPW